ncbi:MAG: ATP-binding protein, partial [Chloroflexota bacterium]
SATLDGGDIRVSVADTGIGIAPEDLPKVFEEFRQLDGSLRRRAGGSGLGLAVSKQFVELHGGSIWVESQVGQGTVFHFTLPHRDNVVAVASSGDWLIWDQRMAARRAPAPEVRVVSTDPGAARVFERYLDGYRVSGYPCLNDLPPPTAPDSLAHDTCVVVAPSLQEGWREVSAWDGGAKGMPIVICALPTRRDLARELGVADYLVKPVAREQVSQALGRIEQPRPSILIIDDDPDMLRLLGRMARVTRPGSRVWLAEGGDAAIAILRSRRPDVVLLDLLMPGLDGYAVLRDIRSDARLRDVPVIVITARGEEEEAVTAGMIGITRRGGLPVGDLMRCLRVSIDALLGSSDTAGPAPAADPIA